MTPRATLLVLAAVASLTASAATGAPDVQGAAQALLTAYAAGDRDHVAEMISHGSLHVYGSDVAEVTSGRDGFLGTLAADRKLWGRGAAFGAMRNVSIEKDRDLASLFFDTSFTVQGRTVPIRFATVWRLEEGGWKLVQCSNVVPTVGQSATDILKTMAKPAP